MPVLLGAWCVGVLAGNGLLVPALAPFAVLAAAVLLATGLAAAGTGRAPRLVLVGMGALSLAVLGAARGAAAVHVPGPGSVDYYVGRRVAVTGVVSRASGSAAFQSLWLSNLATARGGLSGSLQVTARSAAPVAPGATVRASGVVERLPARARDGTTGYDDRLERLGVLALLPSAAVTETSPPGPLDPATMGWRVRQLVAARVRAAVPDPEATVLLGELLGIRGPLPAGIENDLVASGLVHLMAVSGLKVALVGGILAALLRTAGRRAAILAVAGIVAYAMLGGGSAAALRAAAMTSLALVARVLRRDVDAPRSLLLSASVMLAAEPGLGGDPSFQYSFLGTTGIMLFSGRLRGLLAPLPRLPREALTVSVAAQLLTVPVTGAQFHVLPLASPLANLLAIPMLAPTMAATGWLGAGLPDPGGVLAAGVTGSAQLLLLMARAAASIPGGSVSLPWFGAPAAVAYYSAAAAVVLAAGRGWTPAAVATAGAAAAVLAFALASHPDGRVHVTVLDTPAAGDLVTAPDGAVMMVDTGLSAAALRTALDASLLPGQGIDLLVLTGSGRAQVAGLAGLGDRVPGSLAVASGAPGLSTASIMAAFSARGRPVSMVSPGDTFRWHELEVVVTDCGPGVGLEISLGSGRAWICDAGTRADPAGSAPASLVLADAGDGGAPPWEGIGRPRWVAIHGARAGPGDLSVAALGGTLWRTARDGPLELTCTRAGCGR